MNDQPGRSARKRQRWSEAAASADFAFYEIVEPIAQHQWAGGFGFGEEHGTVNLGVLHRVHGVEVSVTTRRAGRDVLYPRHPQRLLADLVMHSVFTDDQGFTLPATWNFTANDRMITVDGVATEFVGVELAIDGSDVGGWAGTALDSHGNGVDIRVEAPWQAPLVLATCTNVTMTDYPPEYQMS